MVHQNAQASPNNSNALNNNSFGLNHRDNPLQSHIVNLQLLKILTVHTSSQTLHRSDNQLYLIITLYQTLSTIDYYSSHSHMHHCIIFWNNSPPEVCAFSYHSCTIIPNHPLSFAFDASVLQL